MSEKTAEKASERQYLWFVGFVDSGVCKKVAHSLLDLSIDADGELKECADGVKRYLVQIEYKLLASLRSMRLGGKPFEVFRQVYPEGKLEKWPPGKPKKVVVKPRLQNLPRAGAFKPESDPPPF